MIINLQKACLMHNTYRLPEQDTAKLHHNAIHKEKPSIMSAWTYEAEKLNWIRDPPATWCRGAKGEPSASSTNFKARNLTYEKQHDR
jgi:hypothetical protein